jgi:hypothetical protein
MLCGGVLRACSCLPLNMRHISSKEGTVALMAILYQEWQSSAEALQPIRSNGIGLESSGSSSDGPLQRWSLHLAFTHCPRQCLELLPKGLGSLGVTWVPWTHTTHVCNPPALASALCLPYLL